MREPGRAPRRARGRARRSEAVARSKNDVLVNDVTDRLRRTRIPWYWVDGEPIPPTTPCSEHFYDGACAICRAGDRPEALGAVIEAVALELRAATTPGADVVEATQRVVSVARQLVERLGGAGACGFEGERAALRAALGALDEAEAAAGAGA